MVKIEETIEEATKNNRVCPMPNNWNKLYQMLDGKRRVGIGWEPPLPLILAAWHETSDLLKAKRLEEHLTTVPDNWQ